VGPGQLQRAAGPALVRLLGPARGRLGRQERGRLAGLCAVDDEVLGPHRRRLRGQAPHPAAASRLPVQRPGRGRGRGRRGRAARQLGESLFPPLFFESAANQNRATKRKRKTHSTLFPLFVSLYLKTPSPGLPRQQLDGALPRQAGQAPGGDCGPHPVVRGR